MIKTQIELQEALTTTFLANLAFLSEYDNELYLRVDELSRMICSGVYIEKYALEFIKEDGEFDIYDIKNDIYFYGKNPKKVIDKLVNDTDFSDKNNIYFLETFFAIYKRFEIENNSKFNFNDNEVHLLTQNDMFAYASILNDFLKEKIKKIKKVDKFIFLGTLTGRHIPAIEKKINAKAYLVLERNLEIFRLSLFIVDYSVLAKNGVIFSIMDNILEEENKIERFVKSYLLENYMLKFSSTGINIDQYIDTINKTLYLVNNSSQYTYNRYLYFLVNKSTQVLSNGYKTLLMNKIKDKFDFFEKLPILFIAAGPSFDESLEWIKINQNKFFIVTVGAAYKKLLDNNIKIDMITTLDESLILEKLQFDDESISKINKDTIILASMKTDLNILKKFDKNNTFLYELTVPFYKGNIKFDGFSVGEVTLDILLKMNAKEIYLIGLDLALNEDSGTSHSINSSSITFKYDLTKEQKKEQFHVKSLIKIKGNLKKEIFSTSYFYNSIKTIEQILGNINENIKIYNLSSLGAYLSNTIPLNIKDLKIECFRNLQYDNISNYLDKFVLTELDKESKLDLNSDITVIKNILCNDLKKLEDMKIKRYEEFYKEVTRLYLSCKVNNNLIIEIMKKYLMMLFPYLSYHFNNAELKNEKEKINKVRNIFVKQLKNILEDYVICLERISK